MISSQRWFVIATNSGAEWDVYQGLLRRGIEGYYPHRLEPRRGGRHSLPVARPIYPGYLFAGLYEGQEVVTVSQTPYVRDVIQNAGKAHDIGPKGIAAVRATAARLYTESLGTPRRIRRWQVGEWIACTDGPLLGLPMEIEAIDSTGRLHVALGTLRATIDPDKDDVQGVHRRAAQ